MAGLEALRLGVKMFNVHALGGFEMMAKLVAEVDKVCPRGNPDRPILLAVTILTSSNQETLRGVGIDRPESDGIAVRSWTIPAAVTGFLAGAAEEGPDGRRRRHREGAPEGHPDGRP